MILENEIDYLLNQKITKLLLVNIIVYFTSIFLVSQYVYHDQVYLQAESNLQAVRNLDYFRYATSPIWIIGKTLILSSFIFGVTLVFNLNENTFKKVYTLFLSLFPITYLNEFSYVFWFLYLNPTNQKIMVDNFRPLSISSFISEGNTLYNFISLLHLLNVAELLFAVFFILGFSYVYKINYVSGLMLYFWGYLTPLIIWHLFIYLLSN